MRKREMEARITRLVVENNAYLNSLTILEAKQVANRHREEEIRLEAEKEANELRRTGERIAKLTAEGYRSYTLDKKAGWAECGYLIGYKYSADGKWLDIQTKDELITVPTDSIVRFAVTDGVMIDR